MLNPSTPQHLTGKPLPQNLFLLVIDGTGNPVGLAPLPLLQSLVALPLQTLIVDGEVKRLDAEPAVVEPHPVLSEESLRGQVESALKRLYDVTLLGGHPLAELRSVRTRVQRENESLSLVRGKAVSGLLCQLIEELRPSGSIPSRSVIPRREWQPYLILRFAYVEGEHNAAIMSWLQISEGTFNRARRRAVETVTKALWEMEAHVI